MKTRTKSISTDFAGINTYSVINIYFKSWNPWRSRKLLNDLRYSDSFLQCNHTNECAQKRLKIIIHVLITECYASIGHAQLKFLTQISWGSESNISSCCSTPLLLSYSTVWDFFSRENQLQHFLCVKVIHILSSLVKMMGSALL